jgi:hypothetical protein
MAGNRATNRERNSDECQNNSVRDEPAREVRHQSPSEDKSVQRTADDSDDLSNAIIERGVLRVRQTSGKDVSVQHRHQDYRDDSRYLGEQSIANGAEPMIAPRLVQWCCHGYLTVKGTAYSRSSQEKRITPPFP